MSLTFKLSESPPELSITVEELTDSLVKMRKAVRNAKVIVARDIIRRVHMLEAKLMRGSQKERISHKINHRLEELKLLRSLSLGRLCKLLLVNDRDASELSSAGHQLCVQDRLVVRLANTKHVNNFVQEFREAHPDWRNLTGFLLYKNVSGKWKSKKQKERSTKVVGSLPLPSTHPSAVNSDANDFTGSCYRVPTIQPEVAEAVDVPPLSPADVDLDSDDASDIAEAIASRALTQQKTLFSVGAKSVVSKLPEVTSVRIPSDRGKKAQKNSSDGPGVLKDGHKLCKTSSKPPYNDGREFTFVSSEGSKKSGLPDVSRTAEARRSDTEDLLGSDDVELRHKLNRRDRRVARFGTSVTGDKIQHFSGRRPFRNHPYQSPHPRRSFQPSRPVDTSKYNYPRANHIRASEPISQPEVGLHPSWQARREQKAKAMAISLKPSPCTKHVVFDD
ncbi:unnamed protein product [Calicophoron daubneyi]|uniref:Serum response factor-binding protein 1 n=1 Tax=Calicophoron daubneyi TaxID=300641 RepID=A0AAV2TSS9_CALDB